MIVFGQIISRGNHSFAITTNNEVFSWGFNGHGELGLSHNNNQNKPQLVEFFKDKSVKNIFCGYRHTFAITNDGDVFSWGNNNFGQCGYDHTVDSSNGTGQLGLGHNYNQSKPQLVDFFFKDKSVKNIFCGEVHTFAISNDGDVFSWGYNNNGQLGLGHYINQNKPQLVEFFKDKTVKKIICGNNYSFAITYDGDVFSWGNNNIGQLGLGNYNNEQNKPQLIDFFQDKTVKNIICGSNHSFAITSDDNVFSWGYNNYGQLGLSYNDSQNKPQLIDFFKDNPVKKIICGGNHTFAISSDCNIFSWGFNNNGQLGLGHNNSKNEPQLVDFFKGKTVKNIICGSNHSFAITTNGDVFSWGFNYNGQLGLGYNYDNYEPQLVKFFCEYKMVDLKNSDDMQTNNETSLKVHLNKIYEKCIMIEI